MHVALTLSKHTIERILIALRSAHHVSLSVVPVIGTNVAKLLVDTDLDNASS